jgi:predicted metal-dependent enzyme (double-stranded beta helix superfamily)
MSTATNKECTIRECADAVMQAIARCADDKDRLRVELLKATKPLRARPDLLKLGTKRPANHIDNSKYLYYDGELSMTLDQLPKGKVIPPHDHGIWEALVLLKGRLHHSVYERTDDGKVDGRAELKTIEDRDFGANEVAMVIPPAEIHSFTALEDDTYVITIVGGDYKPLRHYYNVEKKSYVVRSPGMHRQAQAVS